MPIIPFIALFSGFAIKAGADWFEQHVSRLRNFKGAGFVTLVFGVLLIATSLQHQIARDIEMTRENSLPDTRWASLQWIVQTLPAGARIGREHYTPPVEQYSDKFNMMYLGLYGLLRHSEALPDLDYVVTSSADYDRFFDESARYPDEVRTYTKFFARHELVKEFNDSRKTMSGPTVRVYKLAHD